jgi:hypothetical protein
MDLDICTDLAELFDSDITDMSQLDAADFKDRAYEIWSLVVRARKYVRHSS